MHTHTVSGPVAGLGTRHLVPALSAMLMGLTLVLIVGFAPVAEVHNAAHDTRHTAAFPCH
jgi:cobalt transporter subunit CbtB